MRKSGLVIAAVAVTMLAVMTPAQAADSARPIGDIRVFATLGYPGTPGGLAMDGQTVYVDTSAADMPTFVVFDRDGNLYVGDAGGEPIIWRVPPGGGPAQPWFVDPRLSGTWAGTVLGMTIDPTGHYLYFATGNHQPGIVIYRLPLDH